MTTLTPIEDFADVSDFSALARTVLRRLHERLGFALWMVTRTDGDDWIVLESHDTGYGIQTPALFRWTDSFCSRMVEGHGPRVAPSSAEVPAYAEAPIGKQIPIGAYIGIPLTMSDGKLFGTLCAIDPQPKPRSIEADLPFVELIGSMLSAQLSSDLKVAELTRKMERTQVESETDALTGLFNRRGWDRLLALEEERCRRYGHPASIAAIDLDGLKAVNDLQGHQAGDDLLRRAAHALQGALRRNDVVARVGGDEFTVLLVESRGEYCEQFPSRVRAVLSEAGVSASIGMSARVPTAKLGEAWERADAEMYVDKRRRKNLN